MTDEDMLCCRLRKELAELFGEDEDADDEDCEFLRRVRRKVVQMFAVNFRRVANETKYRWEDPRLDTTEAGSDGDSPESVRFVWHHGDRELWVGVEAGGYTWTMFIDDDCPAVGEWTDVGRFSRLWEWLHDHECFGASCLECIRAC